MEARQEPGKISGGARIAMDSYDLVDLTSTLGSLVMSRES